MSVVSLFDHMMHVNSWSKV